jgi:mRNA interferase MazF
MTVRRGDVILAYFPFASAAGGSKRPALVVQNDRDNQRIRNTLVVQITTNLSRVQEPTHLFLDIRSPDVQGSGLLHDSVVSCINIATIQEHLIQKVIGRLSPTLMAQVDLCLKAALDLP